MLAADTLVLLDGDTLGKPADAQDAARMLRRLAGREHHVVTAVTLRRESDAPRATVELSRVAIAPMTEEEILWYVDTGDLDGGAQAKITIDKPGKYAYHCEIHNFMTGVIEAR